MSIAYLVRRQAGGAFLLVCLLLTVKTSLVLAADTTQITEMIAGLSEALGPEDLAVIYEAVSEVQEPSIRQELKAVLHAKLDALFEPRLQPTDTVVVPDEKPALSANVEEDQFLNVLNRQTTQTRLRAQIEALQLGPEATADTLRFRDGLFIEISQLSDPVARDELLRLLEERERSMANAAAITANK